MDFLLALVAIALAATPVALLAGWFVRDGGRGVVAPWATRDRDAWWRSTLPWPTGIQEDDDLPWTARRLPAPASEERVRELDDGMHVEPAHVRARLRRR